MIKRYCDRCGQQIDEGVHAWYVLELHGTDGEFRHKELCEECYEYLCEKDEAPKADRKTEPTISKMEQVDKDINVRSKDEPQTDWYWRCPKCDHIVPNLYDECVWCLEPKPKDEPQTSCKTCRYGEVDEGYVRCAYYSKSAEQDEPQTERSE